MIPGRRLDRMVPAEHHNAAPGNRGHRVAELANSVRGGGEEFLASLLARLGGRLRLMRTYLNIVN
jgi:hypothetical protein